MWRDSVGRSKVAQSTPLPLPFSTYGARTMPMRGNPATIAGEMAAIGSFRYCRRSSSAIGNREKYENFPVSGIISPRKRETSSSTVGLGRRGDSEHRHVEPDVASNDADAMVSVTEIVVVGDAHRAKMAGPNDLGLDPLHRSAIVLLGDLDRNLLL